MPRIPKHGMGILDGRPTFSRETCVVREQAADDLLSFWNTLIRGILSAALIAVLVILFLL